ncbi:MAG: hypothetical protein R3200_11815 [Xanthomonadales bacterium]|nr:hypothetical protein [Xanthomonadales bacterium]
MTATIRKTAGFVLAGSLVMMTWSNCVWSRVKGSPEAVAAAQGLLAAVGGEATWRKARTLYLQERLFLPDGEVGTVETWQDIGSLDWRRITRSPSGHLEEVIEGNAGWVVRDGVREQYPAGIVHRKRLLLAREPYAIFHRIAGTDETLTVEIGEHGRLEIYDRRMRLLCWFKLDGAGQPIAWGRWTDADVTLRLYGPLIEFGGLRLPRWGTSPDGTTRFERLTARLVDEPITLSDARGGAENPVTPP